MGTDIISLSVAGSIITSKSVSGEDGSAVNADCIVINKGAYEYPGYEKTLEGGLAFSLEEGLPMVTLGHDEILTRHTHQHIWRDLCGQIFDFNLWCLSQAEAALELIMGEVLEALKNGPLYKLGYSRISTFCREVLGFSKSHGYELIKRAVMLKKLPLMREAYQNGHINRSSLRALLKVVSEETQEQWVEKARSLTVRGIEDEVAQALEQQKDPVQASFASDDDGYTATGDYDGALRKGIHVSVKVPADLSASWDYALQLFRKMEGAEVPVTEFLEALLAEYTTLFRNDDSVASKNNDSSDSSGNDSGAFPGNDTGVPALLEPTDRSGDVKTDSSSLDPEKQRMKALYRETRKALEEMTEYWKFLPWKPVTIIVPDSLKGDPSCGGNPFKMAQKLKWIVRMQNAIAYNQGIMLMNLNNRNLNRDMLFVSLSHYAAERLGINTGTAYGRIRMVRVCLDYPEIKERFLSGELSQEKVRLLCKVYKEGAKMMGDWIDYARRAPALKLSKKVDEFIRKRELHEQESRRSSESIRQELIEHGEIYVIDGVEHGPVESDPMGFEARMICRVRGVADGTSLEAGIRAFEMCGMDPEPEESNTGEVFQKCGKRNLKKQKDTEPILQKCETETVTLRFFLPRSLYPLWNMAARTYTLQCGTDGSSPEGRSTGLSQWESPLPGFLNAMLDHFLSVWEKPEKLDFHTRVLRRDNWTCQNPECGCRTNLQAHHMRFRSRGGSNHISNGISLCLGCHHSCVHKGSIVITGESPDNITIVIGMGGDDASAPVTYRNGEKVLSAGKMTEAA